MYRSESWGEQYSQRQFFFNMPAAGRVRRYVTCVVRLNSRCFTYTIWHKYVQIYLFSKILQIQIFDGTLN